MFDSALIVLLFCAFGSEGGYYDTYCYSEKAGGSLKYYSRPATWLEARLRCHLEDAVLMSLLNPDMQYEMREMLRKTYKGDRCRVFVGFNAILSKQDFFSIEGLPVERAPFGWNKVGAKEDCAALLYDKVTAVPCGNPLSYICFKEGPNEDEYATCSAPDYQLRLIGKGYKLDNRTGSWYKFHTTARTWSRAFMTCAAARAHLAIINSDLEAQVLRDLVEEYPEGTMVDVSQEWSAYVGVQDWGERGDWQTIHGQSLTKAGYSRFAYGKPSGSGGCLVVGRDGLLSNVDCESIHGFFCENKGVLPSY